MEEIRTRPRPMLLATILVTAVLIVSGGVAGWLVWNEARSGGMQAKWVFHASEPYANYDAPRFFDNAGSIIVEQAGGINDYLLSLSTSGKLEWKTAVNGPVIPVQGPDGGLYCIEWPDRSVWMYNSSLAGSRNLTALDAHGAFKWDYVAQNGTLDIWGIFSDGEVVAYHDFEDFNMSLGHWQVVEREILGISNGVEMWSMDMPIANSTWLNPRIGNNGTFIVNAYDSNYTRYEVGISKNGTLLYIAKGVFFLGDEDPPESRNGTVEYEERQDYIDNTTSVVNVYAISLVNGSQLWKTELGKSGNPDHMPPGSWSSGGTMADSKGRIYCSFGLNSYALNSEGRILWEKPFLGWMLATYPSGGILVLDNVSLKRIDSNGTQVWRHYAAFDGLSITVLLGSDGTIYYGLGTSVVALAHTTGLTMNLIFLIVIAAVDAAVIFAYVQTLRHKRPKGGS